VQRQGEKKVGGWWFNFIRHYSGEVVVASIRWDEVDEIAVITSETGTSGDDVVWVLTSTQARDISITPTILGFSALLEQIQRLPGFDHATFVAAMGSVTVERFVVWQRPLA
jgi:hypothetical protein